MAVWFGQATGALAVLAVSSFLGAIQGSGVDLPYEAASPSGGKLFYGLQSAKTRMAARISDLICDGTLVVELLPFRTETLALLVEGNFSTTIKGERFWLGLKLLFCLAFST